MTTNTYVVSSLVSTAAASSWASTPGPGATAPNYDFTYGVRLLDGRWCSVGANNGANFSRVVNIYDRNFVLQSSTPYPASFAPFMVPNNSALFVNSTGNVVVWGFKGSSNNVVSSFLWYFNPTTLTWTRGTAIDLVNFRPGSGRAGPSNNVAYDINGTKVYPTYTDATGTQPNPLVYRSNGTWFIGASPVAAGIIAAGHAFSGQAAMPDGKWLLTGDNLISSFTTGTGITGIYDPVNDSWVAGPTMNAVHFGAFPLLDGYNVYVIGSGGPQTGAMEVLNYNNLGGGWTSLTACPQTGRSFNTISLGDGRLLTVGTTLPTSRKTNLYTIATDTWTTLTDVPDAQGILLALNSDCAVVIPSSNFQKIDTLTVQGIVPANPLCVVADANVFPDEVSLNFTADPGAGVSKVVTPFDLYGSAPNQGGATQCSVVHRWFISQEEQR